jgi:hypothetical protein
VARTNQAGSTLDSKFVMGMVSGPVFVRAKTAKEQ